MYASALPGKTEHEMSVGVNTKRQKYQSLLAHSLAANFKNKGGISRRMHECNTPHAKNGVGVVFAHTPPTTRKRVAASLVSLAGK